ncbi:MAG: glycosyltransferase family 4 protein [Candidatus Pacebacteria bacterium]|jgi:glycosyltransferase involved in cell wall biosynthesis|nr:glycosyltransferase family 4 protein [Candidatus Paceibacterota bacterium]
MRILIATSIYPPDIGGSARYARNLYETWKGQGHEVIVASYGWERAAPPGLRHLLYFTKILRKGWNADLVIILDTWTAAVPTFVACKLMNKRYVMRVSGDFLWERYIERTGDLVLFREFYGTRLGHLSDREKVLFFAAQKVMRNAAAVIFSASIQRDIFEKAYGLDHAKSFIVENFCGPHMEPVEPEGKVFFAGTRFLKCKNLGVLKDSFDMAEHEEKQKGSPDIVLDTGKAMYDTFIERMRRSWAVVLVSVSDISPNMIFDAVAAGVPFILTRENGIVGRLGDAAILVDPLDKKEIAEKIVWLSDPKNRAAQAEKVRRISFNHSWKEIADEIVAIWKKAA